MKIRGFADELANGIIDFERLLTLLADRDALEASPRHRSFTSGRY